MTGGPADRETLIELYHEQGLTQSEVGERFDVTGTTIKRWMDKLGVETRRPRPQDVLDEIDQLAEEGAPPKQDEFRKFAEYSVNAAKKRFGSWNEAVEAAGYTSRAGKANEQELLKDLRNLANELGETPTQEDLNKHTNRGHKTYCRKFGSWNQALEAANLEVNHRKDVERFEVECDGPSCDKAISRTENELQQSAFQYCSRECLNNHKQTRYSGRGNPQSTLSTVECEACGKGIDRPKWKREANNRHYCSDCWGDTKVPLECENCGTVVRVWPSVATTRRFCSYDCMGEWLGETNIGENHPRWRGGYGDPYYGPNWRRQRRKAIIRDQARCQDCGISAAEFYDLAGEGLSVHHITPIREFISDGSLAHDEANRLENLVSLCRHCHSLRETKNSESDF